MNSPFWFCKNVLLFTSSRWENNRFHKSLLFDRPSKVPKGLQQRFPPSHRGTVNNGSTGVKSHSPRRGKGIKLLSRPVALLWNKSAPGGELTPSDRHVCSQCSFYTQRAWLVLCRSLVAHSQFGRKRNASLGTSQLSSFHSAWALLAHHEPHGKGKNGMTRKAQAHTYDQVCSHCHRESLPWRYLCVLGRMTCPLSSLS